LNGLIETVKLNKKIRFELDYDYIGLLIIYFSRIVQAIYQYQK